MQTFPISPTELMASVWRSRQLVYALTKREVLGRYRGSALGLLWSLFHPILMLAVYTFVFSAVFKARWSGGSDSKTEFALVIFAGLTVYNLFAECMLRAPSLIVSNVSYVKKVIFPLEILPWVALGSALFHCFVSLVVWLVFYMFVFGAPHLSVLLLPVVLLPLILMTLGFSWALASLGLFVRDTGQMIGVAIPMLMFLTPIFYPISSLPPAYRSLLAYNPLAFVVEQTRSVLIFGNSPDWAALAVMTLISAVIAWLGFAWFQKTRRGFADVI
jgi:lipopolysaccharide transport system permease protein